MYYRQILPVMALFKNKNINVGDSIGKSVIVKILQQQKGGASLFPSGVFLYLKRVTLYEQNYPDYGQNKQVRLGELIGEITKIFGKFVEMVRRIAPLEFEMAFAAPGTVYCSGGI